MIIEQAFCQSVNLSQYSCPLSLVKAKLAINLLKSGDMLQLIFSKHLQENELKIFIEQSQKIKLEQWQEDALNILVLIKKI